MQVTVEDKFLLLVNGIVLFSLNWEADKLIDAVG